ncbi:AAA family ATPase [Solihabitans fulvus]|uniref:AAA family ATPase n=1 Tax=Solihabitans fulvus TaxID=1892852 RepID=A0A5B2XP00_9PSEU|nr:DUF6350 family protein [Solihabitans fulvus]KAA2264631.1 AAA family ATPase [Solihabitans fulvus]
MPVLQPMPHGIAESVRTTTELSRAERARVLGLAAAGSVLLSYAAIAALLALVASTAAQGRFSLAGVLAGAIPGWLAAHHVPLRLDGGQLGALPLLPMAIVLLLAARAAARAARRLHLDQPVQARPVVFAIAGTHAAAGGLLALMLADAPVKATPAVAFFGCGAVAGLAATLGLARRCGLLRAALDRLDPVALRGLIAGVLGLFALLAAGAAIVAVSLLSSWSTTRTLFAAAGPTMGVEFGVWLLCLGYLPNAVIAGMSFLAGSGLSIGHATISPLEFVGGSVPAVPLMAALPTRHVGWLPVVLVLPALVGGLVGWSCRSAAVTPVGRLRAVLVAAVVVAGGGLVLAALAGGRLGAGPFDPVTVPAGLFAVLGFCWIAVPGGLVAWFVRPRDVPAPVEVDESDVDEFDADEDLAGDDEELEAFEDDLIGQFDDEFAEEFPADWDAEDLIVLDEESDAEESAEESAVGESANEEPVAEDGGSGFAGRSADSAVDAADAEEAGESPAGARTERDPAARPDLADKSD